MKVLQLLEELEEIAENSSKVPLTGKSLVDTEDILEIIKEIRIELPEELQRAQWINDERNRLISEAENERNIMLADARAQADAMIDRDDITSRARVKAEEIISNADLQSRNLKMRTYEYLDNVMNSMLERVEYAGRVYMNEMYDNLRKSFDQITETLTDNKSEINNLAYQESVKGRTRDTLDENFLPIERDEDDE
ncbi:MAG: ATPase [Clostridiales bacterium]|nr:ATPase [Clostridiales bacterium]